MLAIAGRAKTKNARKAIRKTPARLSFPSGPIEAFAGRTIERGRKLELGEKLPPEITMTFEDPADPA